MYSHRDPSICESRSGNIFIKNLDKAIDNKGLHDTFSTFGKILSCKVATDTFCQSKGYGYVQYETEESAQKAIEKLNGMLLNDKQIYVRPFVRRQERENIADKTRFSNVFVKNLAESTTDEDLQKTFGQFGKITSAEVMRDMDGKSRCVGFVNFENSFEAENAVEVLNGQKFDDKVWYVGKVQKKSERKAVDNYRDFNLYIKNLDDTVDDDYFKEMFSLFGTITSCKVIRDPKGATAEEASRALKESITKLIDSKPLAFAQRKEDRRARLQAQFSRLRPVAIPPSAASRMPMYPHGVPCLGQQIYYSQGPTAMMPPQATFGYQHQLIPGIRGGAPVPNFFMPMVQQGQRPEGRRAGGAPGQQAQQSLPMVQQQMLPRGRYCYPSARGLPDSAMPGVSGGVAGLQFGMAGMPVRDASSFIGRRYNYGVSAKSNSTLSYHFVRTAISVAKRSSFR